MPTSFLDLKYTTRAHDVLSYMREDGTLCVVVKGEGDIWDAIHGMGLKIDDFVPPPLPPIDQIKSEATSAVNEASIKVINRKINPTLLRILSIKAEESETVLFGDLHRAPYIYEEHRSTGVPVKDIASRVKTEMDSLAWFEASIDAHRIRTNRDIDEAETESDVRSIVEKYADFLRRKET